MTRVHKGYFILYKLEYHAGVCIHVVEIISGPTLFCYESTHAT